MLNKLTHIARTDTAHTKDSIPDFEDPKLIIQVHANKCVEITDFINKDKCAPCDVEDIETLISEYEEMDITLDFTYATKYMWHGYKM